MPSLPGPAWRSSAPVGAARPRCSVSGGCIEDDLIHRIREGGVQAACATDTPAVLRYGISADEAHRFGLPCGGTVELAGQSIGEMSEDDRALVRNQHVGFVFQNFQLVPTLTAIENVLVPVELRGQGGAAAEAEARGLLTRVGLGERCDHYPVQLSGGEQQRVALARAFMNRPKILFCDEPTGNLDGDTAQAMVELIFGLNHEKQTTLVLVTHDLELARRCQRILRLKGGAVVSDSVLAHETH